jgi:UDP-2,3-diacylglucosamine pyrophosphatase LpxH
MGFSFELEHANLVAYLTAPGQLTAPQVTDWELRSFLSATAEPITGTGFMSADKEWVEEMLRIAAASLAEHSRRRYRENDDLVKPEDLEAAFAPLRSKLVPYHLFAVTLDMRLDEGASTELATAARHLALSGRRGTLVLMPAWYRGADVSVLDPLPQFALAMENPGLWPGMLFWTVNGAAAVVPLSDCAALIGALIDPLRGGNVQAVDRILMNYRPPGRGKRLLHLSDLHFGSRWAVQNEALLEGELHSVAAGVNQVVITGDLFDSPEIGAAQAFRNFRLGLKRQTHRDPLLVPGNHDQRMMGMFGQDFRQVADLNWCRVSVDHDLKCVFVGFNSSELGRFARGRISSEQLVRVATELQNAMAIEPAVRTYLPIALVHHHPFSYQVRTETWLQRLLGTFGLNDERFLEMEDSESFVQWCAQWRVEAILHGHKHVPRHVQEYVSTPEGGAQVSAIGCGSSLGAEGSPVAYNLMSWDDERRRWVVSFFASTGGGPFVRKKLAVRQPADKSV